MAYLASYQLADRIQEYLDNNQEMANDVQYVFDYSDPMIDYSKGKHTGQSAKDFYGDIHRAVGAYAKACTIANNVVGVPGEIEAQCDYFYWRLLLNVLIAIFMNKKKSKVYANPQNTAHFSFDAIGPKYCYAYSSFSDISFVLWSKEKGNGHIQLIVKPGKVEYGYSMHKEDLLSINQIDVTAKYNGRQKTVKGIHVGDLNSTIAQLVTELTNTI